MDYNSSNPIVSETDVLKQNDIYFRKTNFHYTNDTVRVIMEQTNDNCSLIYYNKFTIISHDGKMKSEPLVFSIEKKIFLNEYIKLNLNRYLHESINMDIEMNEVYALRNSENKYARILGCDLNNMQTPIVYFTISDYSNTIHTMSICDFVNNYYTNGTCTYREDLPSLYIK